MSDNGHGPQTDPLSTTEALGPEAALMLSYVDPLGFARALGDVGKGLMENPVGAAEAWTRFAGDVARAAAATGARALGADVEGPAESAPKDRRFAQPTWAQDQPD